MTDWDNVREDEIDFRKTLKEWEQLIILQRKLLIRAAETLEGWNPINDAGYKEREALIAELRNAFDAVAEVAIVREKEILGLKTLCAHAADALEETEALVREPVPSDGWQSSAVLIAELRKAAE